MRTLDDFTAGEIIVHSDWPLTAAAITAFAAEYDPQPFHLDPDAPEAALTGGLIASGWQVAAICMRMLCDSFLLQSTCMGSPGVDRLQWLRPVRPGDTLSGRTVVVEVRPSKSRPDRGIVRFRHELANQRGETVMTIDNPILFGRQA
jgi:acyl dehydratase